MDPVTVIVGAIVAGVSAGVTDTVKDQVKATYGALRERLLARFGANPVFTALLGTLENGPDSTVNRAALTQVLEQEQIASDDDLVELARHVGRVSGLDLTILQQLGRSAQLRDSQIRVEGLGSDSAAHVDIQQRLDTKAVVENSGVTVTFGPDS